MQILRTYLEMFMCEEAVAFGSADPRPLPGTNLLLPRSADPSDYTSLIEALPELDSPALFGLPVNISRSSGHAASAAVITQLKCITASQVGALAACRSDHMPQCHESQQMTVWAILDACRDEPIDELSEQPGA